MRVARFYAPGDIRLEDAPEPSPGQDEVKIRVHNCSTCGTDVKIFNHGHHHLVPPRVIGHEIAGEVVESTVDSWVPGDRVQVIAAVPCGTCPDCLRGRMPVQHGLPHGELVQVGVEQALDDRRHGRSVSRAQRALCRIFDNAISSAVLPRVLIRPECWA